MGNRILKESICLDRKIDQLTDFQETLFYRLIVKVDDYGVFLADPAVLASTLYPRKRNLSLKGIGEALKRMESLGLVRLYTCGGEEYLQIVSWEKNQRMRASVHKYPMPEQGESASGDGNAPDSAEGDPAAEVPESAEERPAEVSLSAAEPAQARELPVVELPLNDNSAWGVTSADIAEYTALYPAVDVMQELRNMRGWCMANPEKRKTRTGIRRFIARWLSREQDRNGAAFRRGPGENPFISMAADGSAGEGGPPDSFERMVFGGGSGA